VFKLSRAPPPSPFPPSLLRLGGRDVELDPFSLYEGPAWALARGAWPGGGAPPRRPAGAASRRVLLPGFVVQYAVGGVRLVAYVHGGTGGVYGLAEEAASARAYGAVVRAAGAVSDLLASLVARDVRLLYALVAAAARLLLAPAFLVGLLLASAGVLGHAALAPAARQAALWAEWEQTRAAEAVAQRGAAEEWVFRGGAGGGGGGGDGGGGGAGAGGGARAAGSAPRGARAARVPPAVDESNPWAVLGVQRGATKEALSAAFRREVLKYHPDHAEAAGWDAEAANRRTQLVLDAYRQLRKGK
jgi:DnaJ-domain-containing protein 1